MDVQMCKYGYRQRPTPFSVRRRLYHANETLTIPVWQGDSPSTECPLKIDHHAKVEGGLAR